MQQYRIVRRTTGKGKQTSPGGFAVAAKMAAQASLHRKNKIVKEYHYFKSRDAAAKSIAQDSIADPASSWGRVHLEGRLMCFAAIKYRKY